METLKELLMPKTFNRLSYVAVIGWIVFGVTLLGIVAEMENSEPSFSCSEKSENMDLVPEKCLQQYKEKYNQFGFPLYAFVILNFSLILFVCVIYSEVVRTKVELLEANLNRDAERQRPPETRKLFVAYCCQLAARLALGILFIVLQTQLFYPSYFPTNFNCNLTLTGDSFVVNASGATIQNTTTFECHNQQGGKKNFWTNAVIAVNGVFAVFILIEIICIFSRAKKGRRFMDDSQFLADHLRKANYVNPEHEQQQEPEQQDSQQERAERILLFARELAQQDLQQQRNEIPEEPQLESLLEAMKESISKNTEKPSDLKALFKTNPGEGEKTKDLSIDKIYTNLRFHPNRAEYDFSENREEQLKVYPEPKRQGVDTENLQPKGPEDIVDAENKKVLIVGRPGIGKSLFCTKFLRDWAMGRVFNNTQDTEIQYNVAFLVKFRKFNSAENLSLRELLARSEYSQTEHLSDGVWTCIRENPEKVLILLDGLDEFKDIQGIIDETVNNKYNDSVEQEMPPAALFSKIANGKLLSGATVVTTTRPTAVSKIADHIELNKVFEIVGFSSEQVEEYVENFTKNAAENLTDVGQRIKQHIKTNMNLFSLCYIPVNCFIICSCLLQIIQHCTKKGKDLTGAVLPEKFTQIYKIAVKLFFFRHNEQYKDKVLSREEIESEFPPEVEEKIFKPLGKVAFDGVKERRLIFIKSEVQGLEDSGLLHQLPDDERHPFKHEAQFCFIHLTMQEFFAAKHIVDTMNEAQLREFVCDHIKKGEWHVVLQFVAGLLGERKRPIEIFTEMLPVKTENRFGFTYWPTHSDKHLALTIIKCLFECESKESHSVVKSKLEEIGFNAVDFSWCNLAPSDCTAVVHALKNVPQISCIDLSNNHIGSLGCVEIRKLLDNGNCQITQLDLRGNNIGDNGVLELCKVITNSKLTELDLGHNKITDVDVLELCKVITNSKLTELGLSYNKITNVGVLELCNVITNSKLTWLNISGNKITDVGVLELSNVITNSKLTTLYLGNNKITDVGVSELCKVITNSKLTGLYLSSNEITDVGVNNLCDVLTNPNCKLIWLNLINIYATAEASKRITNANPNCKVYI